MANKAIFLDRDETLIEDPGYINDPDQVKLLDGVHEALIELQNMGYKLVIVSNQSGVARGIVTEEVLGKIHDRLKQLLAEKNLFLDKIYYCPYHPDGVIPKYRKESDWRKPAPGMLLAAAKEMDIDLGCSWSIGNSGRDIEAGAKAGCKTILLEHHPRYKQPEPGRVNPDYRAVNMKEAVNIIKKHNRSSAKTEPPSSTAAEQQPQTTEKTEQRPETIPQQDISAGRTEELLISILGQLKNMQRKERFEEFSIMRLTAGIVQVAVLFCLLISIWFLLSPAREENGILISLGFAMLLQVMALTFYVMQSRK
jgi:D-glycero-D-manno-heptose 1,7-bisphosphate phosphatase